MRCPLCKSKLTRTNRLFKDDKGISTPTNNYTEVCQNPNCQMYVKIPLTWRIENNVPPVEDISTKTDNTEIIARGNVKWPTKYERAIKTRNTK